MYLLFCGFGRFTIPLHTFYRGFAESYLIGAIILKADKSCCYTLKTFEYVKIFNGQITILLFTFSN